MTVEAWTWHMVYEHEAAISILVVAMGILLGSIFPERGPARRRTPAACVCAAILCGLGVARLRRATRERRPPRWAARALRLMPPSWCADVQDQGTATVS